MHSFFFRFGMELCRVTRPMVSVMRDTFASMCQEIADRVGTTGMKATCCKVGH
jgi:hypothetical protein